MRALVAVALACLLLLGGLACRRQRETAASRATITVYGFSVVKEPLEQEIFPAFEKYWRERTGQEVKFDHSFAGSEMITNQILSGVKADLAILSIERDAERLRDGKATRSDWHDLPFAGNYRGIVNRTPFVIVVRKGNPKKIRDFEDLAKPGVKLIHPDPVSSGGAQWSLLAIYGSEVIKSKRRGRADGARGVDLVRRIWKNVIATPGSARETRTQFEAGFGDALVTYELEALQLTVGGGPFEMVTPQSTIFSEHPVVIIDRDMGPDKRALVELFANFLWSETAQRAWVKHYFRAVTDERLNAAEARFARIALPFTVADFGGWGSAYRDVIEGVWKQQIQSGQ